MASSARAKKAYQRVAGAEIKRKTIAAKKIISSVASA